MILKENFRGITFPQGSTQKAKELVLSATVLRMPLKLLETKGRVTEHKWRNRDMPIQLCSNWHCTSVDGGQGLSHLLQSTLLSFPKNMARKGGSLVQWESTFTQLEIISSSVSPPKIPILHPKQSLFRHLSKVIFLGHIHRPIKHHTFIFSQTNRKWWRRHQLFNGYRNCVFYTLEIWFSWATIVQHLVSLTLLTLLSVTDFCFPGS